MRHRRLVALAAALVAISGVQAGASVSNAATFVGGVNGQLTRLDVGSLVAQGTPRDGTCHFPGTTSFGAMGATSTVHITTSVTESCAMVVSDKGPADDTDGVGAGVVQVLVDTEVPGADTLLEPRTKVPRKGETEFTILEQFNITAYELHLALNALQATDSGDISAANWDGSYCYVSAFPGNQIRSCYGNFPSRGGDYAEAQIWGHFDNTSVGGPDMLLHTVHIITRSNSGGLCEMVEGDYPLFWHGDCKINRIN